MTYERPVRESGELHTLKVDGLDYDVRLPLVWLPSNGGEMRIASLDLVGQTRLNRDMGNLLAERLRPLIKGRKRVTILTATEKALQLAQVVAERLGLDEIAVAHNRVKPHMEPSRRPVIQVGADSITSGDKFLALYERSLHIVNEAADGVILLDDVVSTGSTMIALQALLDEAARHGRLPASPPVLAMACAAVEGEPALTPLVYLAKLPVPVFRGAS
ncbi:MAG: adenine phosphoribosyltransferase [Thermodesulfobacteriota bacterium]